MDSNRAERSRSGRVPPHNLEAEDAILGAALLSVDAARILVEQTAAADYYSPANGRIARAISTLVVSEVAPDPVTVAEQLRQDGALDDVGGMNRLGELMNATPSVSSAAHYARIVTDAARLRRLLTAGAGIVDLAYSTAPADISAAIDRATASISELVSDASGEIVSTLSIPDIGAALDGTLEADSADLLLRTDGLGLIYPGKMHMFQAEPSVGKSWVAFHLCSEVLAAGGSAVVIDYEDSLRPVLVRMQTVGANHEQLRTRFRYVHPEGPMGAAEILRLFALVEEMNPDVVVIDGVAESLSRDGLSEDSATDFVQWTDKLPRRLARTGAAVVMLDHVAKDSENRGRWARGTGAKLAVLDGAAYTLRPAGAAFSKHRAGKVKLTVAKDRPGSVGAPGETAAVIEFEPHAAGSLLTITVHPDNATMAATDPWRPTILMEKISRALEESKTPLTATGIAQLVHSEKAELRAEALERLKFEGHVVEEKRKGSKYLRLLEPFRSDEKPRHLSSVPDEPPPDDHLFDPGLVDRPEIEEPEWLAAERTERVDQYSYDPEL